MSRQKNARHSAIKTAVDKFWEEHHYPPTIRDLMKMTGISSTSVAKYYMERVPGVRFAEHGRIIPLWVDDVFENAKVMTRGKQ